jgi:hypothetical protein
MLFIEIGVIVAIFVALIWVVIREESRRRCAFTLDPERRKLQRLIVNLEDVVNNLQDISLTHRDKERSQ